MRARVGGGRMTAAPRAGLGGSPGCSTSRAARPSLGRPGSEARAPGQRGHNGLHPPRGVAAAAHVRRPPLLFAWRGCDGGSSWRREVLPRVLRFIILVHVFFIHRGTSLSMRPGPIHLMVTWAHRAGPRHGRQVPNRGARSFLFVARPSQRARALAHESGSTYARVRAGPRAAPHALLRSEANAVRRRRRRAGTPSTGRAERGGCHGRIHVHAAAVASLSRVDALVYRWTVAPSGASYKDVP